MDVILTYIFNIFYYRLDDILLTVDQSCLILENLNTKSEIKIL